MTYWLVSHPRRDYYKLFNLIHPKIEFTMKIEENSENNIFLKTLPYRYHYEYKQLYFEQ